MPPTPENEAAPANQNAMDISNISSAPGGESNVSDINMSGISGQTSKKKVGADININTRCGANESIAVEH